MKSIRLPSILAVGLCLLLLAAAAAPGATAPSPVEAVRACQPRYGEQEYILTVNDSHPLEYEPSPTAADFNGDDLEDVVITKMTFQTRETYALDILVNDGHGSLALATPGIFAGAVPEVQNPRETVVADFNGDGRADIFVADHGFDAFPFPGYQNQLVLTAPGGKLVNATGNLPQQDDFTHSACAADIDNDEDIDLYVGNIWGQHGIDPQIWLNDGHGRFAIAANRLPPSLSLHQNGYTTCAFADVNHDNSQDLVLGDAGDDIANEHSTPDSVVLLNDGAGAFAPLPQAMPAKVVSAYDIGHDIEPVDLNGDAYVDLLIVYEGWEGPNSGWRGSYLQALVNNGNGTFRDETAARLEPLTRRVWIHKLELRDIDRDGDLDLLARPWDDRDPNPILYLNDGSGRFRRQPLDFKLSYLNYAFLDLGGDGGHDLVMITFAPPEEVYAIRDQGCPVFLPSILHQVAAASS